MEQKIRVLLADDDSEFCARMAAALEKADDMELVGMAEDGGKALAAMQELRPDLLIIDLVLPVMDGISVISQMRSQEQNKTAVVVLSSSHTSYLGSSDYQAANWYDRLVDLAEVTS